jgi:hypothetical protein
MRTERLSTNGDLLAVGLVGNTVDLLDVVGVGDDLVASENVLRRGSAKNGGVGRHFARRAATWCWTVSKGGVAARRTARDTHLVDDHVDGGGVDVLEGKSEGGGGVGRRMFAGGSKRRGNVVVGY